MYLIFDDLADEVMLEGEWATAITRATLAQTTNTPVFDYDFEYQLPVLPFCLKVLELDESPVGTNRYAIEGDKLLVDMTTVGIRYIGRITNTEKYGNNLQQAIVARLALELAYRLTGDKGTARILEDQYNRILTRGLASDGQQGSKRIVVTPDLTEVR